MPDRLTAATAQLLGTLALLAAVPPAPVLLLALPAWWALTLGRPGRRELLAMLGLDLLFTALDAGAVRAGVFVFHRPDWLGLPWWEPLMWGFWTIHGLRLVGGTAPPPPRWWTWVLAAAFAAPYLAIADPAGLALTAGAVLALALVLLRTPRDWAAAGYFAAMGAAVEATGLLAGHWHYPGWDGLPPGAVVMWAGVGLFARRLLASWMDPNGPGCNTAA